MPVEQRTAGSTLAPVLSALENGAALGTYDKALITPKIKDARDKLVGEEALQRFDRIMKLFQMAGSHTMQMVMMFPLAERYFPPQSFGGENAQILYLLMLGAGGNRDRTYLDRLTLSYKTQLAGVAENLEKAPGELTLVDLGEAIISGKFQPEEL